ncbi:MAG: alpha/beta hydrolase [Planctomycetes bacterium]|nr:alpha/beta hydrolase [Planctomycetota bacterium]
MPKYWMISNRAPTTPDELGRSRGPLTYWTADTPGLHKLSRWRPVPNAAAFQTLIAAAADEFPSVPESRQTEQRHVTLFVHGYNNTWSEAAERYEQLCRSLYTGPDSLGLCVLFTWPSNGNVYGYLPDREDARATAPDLAGVLNTLYDWMLRKQHEAALPDGAPCKAKTSVLAHSMGNYVLQNAMQYAWTRNNQPLLVSLVNQLVMIAADVDNDLFASGERQTSSDGDAIANLTYRITALYSGRDDVLGVSAGLKHFGKRRLGRSGLDRTQPLPDNVWDADCSKFFTANKRDIHSAYFETKKTLELVRDVLTGVDRGILKTKYGV